MVGHKCPGKAFCAGLGKKLGEVADKATAIIIVVENVATVHATDNYVLEKIRSIYTGSSRHAERVTTKEVLVN